LHTLFSAQDTGPDQSLQYVGGRGLTFHEIHRLKREGFSDNWIARHLVLNRRTIKKYLHMNEEEYLLYKDSGQPRKKLLAPYEDFVHIRLEECPDASAAQVHDWLYPNNNKIQTFLNNA